MIWVKNWNENREGPDVDIFNIIQIVQDTVIHLEVDEEQWKITQWCKRQAQWVWSPRTMSGLRLVLLQCKIGEEWFNNHNEDADNMRIKSVLYSLYGRGTDRDLRSA